MLITNPEKLKEYRAGARLWQGIPGIERTKKGRFFYTFYTGGVKEEIGNYVLLYACREDECCETPIAVAYRAGSRCFDPCLWIDPLGRLWFIWSMMPEDRVYAAICDAPDAKTIIFGEPFEIAEGVMMNKPTVLTSGEWLFPIASWSQKWRSGYGGKSNLQHCGAFAYKTADNGKTFSRLGGADIPRRAFDEHMLLEQQDGTLSMYIRTEYGIGVAHSLDRGEHWSAGEDSGLGGPCSRFFICRLRSGRVLLINHYRFKGRNNLTALLSEDDGKSYPYTLLLDGRNAVSYPDAIEDESGNIYIIYDRERGAFLQSLDAVYAQAREILVAKITEADIMAGKLVTQKSYLQRVISRLGVYEWEQENPYGEAHRYDDATLAARILGEHTGEDVVQAVLEAYPPCCTNLHLLASEQMDALFTALADSNYRDEGALRALIRALRCAYAENAEQPPVIERVKAYVRQHLAEPLTLATISREMGMSMHYLCHLFKKETGTTIVSFINAGRLMRAKQLLLAGDERIGDIAARCGFDGASYFAEVFAAAEGMSPSEYRRLHEKA